MKRRYKLLIIIFISFLLAIFIYKVFYNQDRIYLFLGDDFHNKSTYSFNDYLVKDYDTFISYADKYQNVEGFNKLIKANDKNINYYLKNASLIVISLPVYELNNHYEVGQDMIIEYLNSVYNLLCQIKHQALNKVVLINLNNPKFDFINSKIKKYAKELGITYIDESLVKSYNILMLDSSVILTREGHKIIYEQIQKIT